MKATLLFAMLPMMLSVPGASAATELETLRARCTEQEQQIQALQEQVRNLRGEPARPMDASAAPAIYTVRSGDSLERIARRNHCEVTTLAKTNGLKLDSMIHPGQKLKVPGSTTKTSPASAPSPRTHKIGERETYYSISRKYGIPVETLIAANPKAKATALYPGLVIRLAVEEPSPAQTKPQAAVADSKPGPAPAIATTSRTLSVSAPAPNRLEPLVLEETPATSALAEQTSSLAPEKKIRSVMIEGEMTYAAFAAKHGTDTGRLNDLNGLDLTSATVLAKGSELYVPAQP